MIQSTEESLKIQNIDGVAECAFAIVKLEMDA